MEAGFSGDASVINNSLFTRLNTTGHTGPGVSRHKSITSWMPVFQVGFECWHYWVGGNLVCFPAKVCCQGLSSQTHAV